MNYSRLFQTYRAWSRDLQGSDLLWLAMMGFVWVRPVLRRWENTLRAPTMGRLLEFAITEDVGFVPVSSIEGQRLVLENAVR
jgi:hypothetical protein